MNGSVERAHRIAIAGAARVCWRICAPVALLLLALWYVTAGPSRYEIWLDGRMIAAGRDLSLLAGPIREHLYTQMQRQITLEAGETVWQYRLSELGLTIASEGLADALASSAQALPFGQRLRWSSPKLHIQAQPRWDAERLEAALAPIKAAVERVPVPARLSIVNGRPVITPEEMGRSVKSEDMLAMLQQLDDTERLQVPVSEEAPEVTRQTLEKLRIKRLLAEWSTRYDASIPRAENVEKAAQAFNGIMLKPGDILSYNATIGPVNAADGWREAYVIVNGKLVPGIGGGICQVATTFYGAALRANLGVVERHPHQLAVPYTAPSQDAAIAQGWQDLKLRNTTQGHILIEAEAEGGQVMFRIYGDLPEEEEVVIESRVLESRPFPVEILPDPTLAPGEERLKVKGYAGLTSEAYRLIYRDGKLIKREFLSRDHYMPTTEVVLRGPSADFLTSGQN